LSFWTSAFENMTEEEIKLESQDDAIISYLETCDMYNKDYTGINIIRYGDAFVVLASQENHPHRYLAWLALTRPDSPGLLPKK